MIRYRPMEEKDLSQVMEIEKSSFSQPWSEEAMRRELRENSEMAHYIVAESEGQIIAYAGYWQIFDEAHITNVAVEAAYRRRGVGRELMRQLEAQYRLRGILYATLEVRAGNTAARRLYAGCGFSEAGVRPGFYEKPKEDGVVMWKKIE